MTKKSKGPGCLAYLFIISFMAISAIFIFFSNTFNFKTLVSYGPSQYFANIGHFHSDYYCQAASSLKLYKNILPSDSIEKKPITVLTPGKRFKFNGYRSKEFVTWVAAKVAHGSDVIYGYFMVPDKIDIPKFWETFNGNPLTNKYFNEIPSKLTQQFKSVLLSDLKTILVKSVDLKKTTVPVEMQRIKDSSDYEIIKGISTDTVVYYCPKIEYKKANELYEGYIEDGFDIHYLQVGSTYDPNKNGIFIEGSLMRFADSWYLKVVIILFFLLLCKRIFIGSNSTRSKPKSKGG